MSLVNYFKQLCSNPQVKTGRAAQKAAVAGVTGAAIGGAVTEAFIGVAHLAGYQPSQKIVLVAAGAAALRLIAQTIQQTRKYRALQAAEDWSPPENDNF